ncbi:hypothetical protein BDD12DRAFT_874247 [Trichophaea hybrida]|nr:hypothetical protein BDD12DRAFT_874247 [Trichophaea hybrida]
MPRRARPPYPKIHYSSQFQHCPNCNKPLVSHHPPTNYGPLERPPYKWKGYSLRAFDNSVYLRRPKERDGIFFTNQHLTEYRWLVKYHKAQIKDIERVHYKELRLLVRRRAIVLQRCRVRDKATKTKEFENNFDILRFQQLWEKSLVYCRLRIELHHLRTNSRRKLLGQPELTGAEKEGWNQAFLSEVRKEQWLTLLKIKAAFVREGLSFPEHLRAPYGQSFDSYFGKLGTKFGWYRAGDLALGGTVDGAGTPGLVFQSTVRTFSVSLDSEDISSKEKTICSTAKKGFWRATESLVGCYYRMKFKVGSY